MENSTLRCKEKGSYWKSHRHKHGAHKAHHSRLDLSDVGKTFAGNILEKKERGERLADCGESCVNLVD